MIFCLIEEEKVKNECLVLVWRVSVSDFNVLLDFVMSKMNIHPEIRTPAP